MNYLTYMFILFAILLAIIMSLVVSWITCKACRVFIPELNNVSCIKTHLCLEDTTKADEAKDLYLEAYKFINISIDKIRNKPKVIFCSTLKCSKSFGIKQPWRGKIVGPFAIIIAHTGWTNFSVRHQMIHHLQYENINILRMRTVPTWFREGMVAYYLLRSKKLSGSWLSYRSKFEEWFLSINKNRLWHEAKKL